MRDKFILETYNEDGEMIDSQIYKTYKQIAFDINTSYANVRTINHITENILAKKFTHRQLTELLKRYKIRDVQV